MSTHPEQAQVEALLPCPFCGATMPVPHDDACYFTALKVARDSEDADVSWAPAVLAGWNRRAALTTQAAPAEQPEAATPEESSAVGAVPAPVQPVGEPLFLLHCGQVDSSGEQDDWDCEADSWKRVEDFCRLHPGQTSERMKG